MVTVRDIIPMLLNPDKKKPEKIRVVFGKEKMDIRLKMGGTQDLLDKVGDYVIETIYFDWNEQIWLINVKIAPVKA